MREDLLGYLLGALEPDQMRRVEAWLQSDPAARQELQQLKAALLPLDEARDREIQEFEAPADLLARTLDFVERSRVQPASTPSALPADDLLEKPVRGLSRATAGLTSASSRRWRVPDALVATVSMMVLAALVFPALLDGRHLARRQQCQNNLQRIGYSLAHYAITDPQQRLPKIDLRGPSAFAGMYAVELKTTGAIQDDRRFWCPSFGKPQAGLTIPTVDQIQSASGTELARLQRLAGGHYAYTLGVIDENRHYQAPQYSARSTFALLADSQTKDADGLLLAHDGLGYNLLFEDGHVVFVSESSPLTSLDQPFVNQENRTEAGLNLNDASLGESSRAPFLWVKQSH